MASSSSKPPPTLLNSVSADRDVRKSKSFALKSPRMSVWTSRKPVKKIGLLFAALAVGFLLLRQKQSRSHVIQRKQCEKQFNETVILRLEPVVMTRPENPQQDKADVPMPLYHDLFQQDSWPGVDWDADMVGSLPRTVHYMWCENEQFLFRHYLTLLSALRVLKASKINFLHKQLPQKDENLYNIWFEEFVYSVPNVNLISFQTDVDCNSPKLMEVVLGYLAAEGGVFLGKNAVIPRLPGGIKYTPFWFAFSGGDTPDPNKGVIIAQAGFDKTKEQAYYSDIMSAKSACITGDKYEGPVNDICCVIVDKDVHPCDVWQEQTPFAELARWLYYGRRATVVPAPDASSPIPRIIHCVWLTDTPSPSDFPFSKYLSVLSALHVGGFYRVYVHGNTEPQGEWWKRLASDNVTFVKIERPSPMFQMDFPNLQASSDFLRILLLLNYGGAYMDTDVVWTSRVPDWLLQYPAVASRDWPEHHPWPDNFNLGVLLSRAQNPWLRQWLSSFRHYRLSDSGFTGIVMPYKMYEHVPDGLFVYDHLQVICYYDICHPTWEKDFRRPLDSSKPTLPFNLTDVHAVHVTQPKPADSFASPASLKEGKDFMAEIGRHVLRESGRMHLLS